VLKLAASIIAPLAVAAVSGAATARSVRDWYPTLEKPFFTPPSWLFGPVWTALYVMMGIALYLVWREGWDRPDVRIAMLTFAAQLVLNGLWSIVFFGMRAPGAALAEIIVLLAVIVATAVLFWRISTIAGGLLVPYIAWVSFATALNASVWWLNR
jgi:tryptophan-rich sensory protein